MEENLLKKEFLEFTKSLNHKESKFFNSIKNFSKEMTDLKDNKIFFGVYCVPDNLFLYSDNSEAHSLLDFHVSTFFKKHSIIYPQNKLLFHNLYNQPGNKLFETKINGIYLSTFAGKNLRTFGNFYLPDFERNILLNNL